MNTSAHERCSELLGGHLRGDLDAAERSWVDEHLSSCADCRAEESALRTLGGAAEAPALTEIERGRLRRAVLTAVTSEREVAATPPAAARGGRLLQVLGAAALLLIIGVFMYSSGLVGGGLSGGDADTAGEAERAEAPASLQDEDALEAGAGDTGADESAATTSSGLAAAPEPSFRRSMGTVSGRRLNRLGRSGLPLVIFSRAYRAEQVPDLQAEFRDRLASAAGPKAEVVRECSDLVTKAFPHSLPAYGALATLEKVRGRQVLVLAFAWTDKPTGPLDQSMVWAWPADNCDQPVEYYKNVIQPKQ